MRPIETRRFLVLVGQLEEEAREETGSDKVTTRVAERLGIDPSYISHLRKRLDRKVGGDALQGAIKALGVSPRFFTDPSLGEAPDYREHLLGPADAPMGTRLERDDAMALALRELLERYAPDDPRRPTPDEVENLRGISYRELLLPDGRITADAYQHELWRMRDRKRGGGGLEIALPESPDTVNWTPRSKKN